MIHLGLTGGIASGKSTIARMCAAEGAHVFDADMAVHHLLAEDPLIMAAIIRRFPDVLRTGAIDRAALGNKVFGDAEALGWLETLLHPGVRRLQKTFLKQACRRGWRLVVSEIPLLFETGSAACYDATLLVSAPDFLIRQRALARLKMTKERLENILARQMPVAEKRKVADMEITTGLGMAVSRRAVKKIMREVL